MLGGKNYNKNELTIKCSLEPKDVQEALEIVDFLKESGIGDVAIMATNNFGCPEIYIPIYDLTLIGLEQIRENLKKIKEFYNYRRAVSLLY